MTVEGLSCRGGLVLLLSRKSLGKRPMVASARALIVALLLAPSAYAEPWAPLFNGKNLDGWTAKINGYQAGDNYADTFRVEDGLLKVRFDKYEGEYARRFGHLFYDKPLTNYRLRVEYRVVGEQAAGGPGWANRNSGLMIYGQTPQSMRLDQEFPVSIEVQLLGALPGRARPTANLCTPGTHVVMGSKLHTPHCKNSTSPSFPDGEWVTVEVEARGGQMVRHLVNGEAVLEYAQPQLDPRDPDAKALLAAGATTLLTGGTLSLQAESHPIDFRRVEVMMLEQE